MRAKALVAIVCGLVNPIPPVKAGGPQLVIWNTCKHLDEADFDWKVLSLWDEAVETVEFDRERFVQVRIGEREERLSSLAQKLPYRLVKGWFGVVRQDHLALNLAMVRELKHLQPDVVIVHESYSLCFMVARALPKVRVVFYHHSCKLHIDLNHSSWERLLKSANGGIITINHQAIRLAEEKFGLGPKRNWVILNGVDESYLDLAAKLQARGALFDNKDATFRFLYVGRIHEGKGLIELLEAMDEVSRFSPGKAELLIVGSADADEDGENRFEQELRAHAEKLSMGSVRFLGFVPNKDLPEIYRQADCGVLPTQMMEGNSLFLMECLAMGVPVIATRIGGVPDVVREGVDGVLIDQNYSSETLTQAMKLMIEEKPRWEQGRVERIDAAALRFSFERVGQQIKSLLGEIIETSGYG